MPGTTPVGFDPTGLTHTPYNAFGQVGYGASFGGTPFGTQFGAGITPPYLANNPFIDPFGVQRGLSHSPAVWGVSPLALEMARQQQLTQAIAARQSVLEAMCRTVGIPV